MNPHWQQHYSPIQHKLVLLNSLLSGPSCVLIQAISSERPHIICPRLHVISGKYWQSPSDVRSCLWVADRALFQYKDCLSKYRDSHYEDKISLFLMGIPTLSVVRIHVIQIGQSWLVYLCNSNSYTFKTTPVVWKYPATCFNMKTVFQVIDIPIIKTKLLWDCLIFIMSLVRQHLMVQWATEKKPSWHINFQIYLLPKFFFILF